MDLFQEVFDLEDQAFAEGKAQGREEALVRVRQENKRLGRENGCEVAREVARVKTLASLFRDHPSLAQVVPAIEAIEIQPEMSREEINSKYLELASLFKLMLAKLKIKPVRTPTLGF